MMLVVITIVYQRSLIYQIIMAIQTKYIINFQISGSYLTSNLYTFTLKF